MGKANLDAHIAAVNMGRQFDNTNQVRRTVRNGFRKPGVSRAVFETTGSCHRDIHQCLSDFGIETVLVNPLRSIALVG
ncbi:MAG: hypothetical protein OXN89_02545 [Bryobacterales bacterium]|nr:hypothetical protein [Bryobacterales bacterium]